MKYEGVIHLIGGEHLTIDQDSRLFFEGFMEAPHRIRLGSYIATALGADQCRRVIGIELHESDPLPAEQTK